MKTYNKRTWLNKNDSPSLGSVVAFDGQVEYSDGDERTTFLALSDCGKTIKLIKNTENIEDFIAKMKLLNNEICQFIEHLEKQYNDNLITEAIIKKVFRDHFNDGRLCRGTVGIWIMPTDKGWEINSTRCYKSKYITTIEELDAFLKEEGVPFDFKSCPK